MQKINLFPPWMLQQKRRQRIIRYLMAAQLVVFLLLGGAFFAVQIMEERVISRSAALTQILTQADRAPILAAEAVTAAEKMRDRVDGFLEERFPVIFDPDWLVRIIEAVPEGVELTSFDFSGTTIAITAVAEGLSDIGIHQQLLGEIECFGSVMLGQVNRMADGRVRYNLRISLEP
jgi:Tfp pilus assembly protein PilN